MPVYPTSYITLGVIKRPKSAPSSMAQTAALLFVLLSLLVGAFQVALILGAPWGEFTMGGRWRNSLPSHARFIAVVSAALVGAMAVVITARAGLAYVPLQSWAPTLSWVVVGYCALGTLANAVTPSRRERAAWLPVILCMLVLSILVATS